MGIIIHNFLILVKNRLRHLRGTFVIALNLLGTFARRTLIATSIQLLGPYLLNCPSLAEKLRARIISLSITFLCAKRRKCRGLSELGRLLHGGGN